MSRTPHVMRIPLLSSLRGVRGGLDGRRGAQELRRRHGAKRTGLAQHTSIFRSHRMLMCIHMHYIYLFLHSGNILSSIQMHLILLDILFIHSGKQRLVPSVKNRVIIS